MRLAVVDDHANILQRISRDVTALENVAHAFLDGRNELLGDRAALHRVDELESLATRQRLDLEEDFAKLSGATGLFFMPAVTVGFRGDRLAKRNRWRMGVELDFVLGRDLLKNRLELHLAESAHDGLVGLGVVLDAEARVFCSDLVE